MEAMLKQIQNEIKMNKQAIEAAKQKLSLLEGKDEELQQIAVKIQEMLPIPTEEAAKEESTKSPRLEPEEKKKELWSDMVEQEIKQETKQQEAPRKKGDFYVIFDGPFKGIYKDWHIVSSHVTGTRYAHKKYKTREEAEEAYKGAYKAILKKEPEPKNTMLKMKKIINLTSIPTTAEKLALKELTQAKIQTMEQMLVAYSEINTTMQFYPKNTKNGVRAIILPGAEPMLTSDFYLCGLIDTLYIQDPSNTTELPIGLQQAIRSYTRFANGREIFMRFSSMVPAISEDKQKEETPQLIQIGISNGNYPTRDEDCGPISGDQWFGAIKSLYGQIHRINTQGKYQQIRVNYFRRYTLVYSTTNKETSIEDKELLLKYEDLIGRQMEPFKHLSEDIQRTICMDFSSIEGHSCQYCGKSEDKGKAKEDKEDSDKTG